MRVLSRRLMRDSEIASPRITHAAARAARITNLALETCGEICSIPRADISPCFVKWAFHEFPQNYTSNFPTRISRAHSTKNPPRKTGEISYTSVNDAESLNRDSAVCRLHREEFSLTFRYSLKSMHSIFADFTARKCSMPAYYIP